MAFHIARYKSTRHWALWDDDELVAVTVYRRGAEAVQRRLAAPLPTPADATATPPPAQRVQASSNAGQGSAACPQQRKEEGMDSAAHRRGDRVLPRQADAALQAAYRTAHTRAWAEVTVVGRTSRGMLDVSLWYENYAGDLFGFTRFEVWRRAEIAPEACRRFAAWTRWQGLTPEAIFWGAGIPHDPAPGPHEEDTP